MRNCYRFAALLAISLHFSCGKGPLWGEEAVLWKATEEVRDDLARLGFDVDLSDIQIEVRDEQELNRLYQNIQELSEDEVTAAGKASFQGVERKNAFASKDSRQAFYDANSKSIVFKKGSMRRLSKGYLAHELIHAFQDQQWGLDEVWQYYRDQPSRDRYNIVQALIEGYAELGRYTYEQNVGNNPTQKRMSELSLGRIVYSDCVACTFSSSSSLPYNVGTDFLAHAYLQGGWPLVERYFTNPPTTSERLLHPEKEPSRILNQVNLPTWSDSRLPGKQVFSGTMGEAFLLSQLLDLKVSNAEAFSSASGWAGDTAQLYMLNDGTDAMVWSVLFDRKEDAAQMVQSLSNLGGQHAYYLSNNIVTWIIADRPQVKDSIARFLSLEQKNASNLDQHGFSEEDVQKSREVQVCSGTYSMAKSVRLTKRN